MSIGIAKERLSDPMGVDDDVHRRMVYWQDSTGGQFDAAPGLLESLLPHMQIHCVRNGESQYLYCGLETTTTALFGVEFALAAMGRPGVPDQEFERVMSQDYLAVQEAGKRIYERVYAPICVYGRTYHVEYYRFVFPVVFEGVNAVGVSARFASIPALLN